MSVKVANGQAYMASLWPPLLDFCPASPVEIAWTGHCYVRMLSMAESPTRFATGVLSSERHNRGLKQTGPAMSEPKSQHHPSCTCIFAYSLRYSFMRFHAHCKTVASHAATNIGQRLDSLKLRKPGTMQSPTSPGKNLATVLQLPITSSPLETSPASSATASVGPRDACGQLQLATRRASGASYS